MLSKNQVFIIILLRISCLIHMANTFGSAQSFWSCLRSAQCESLVESSVDMHTVTFPMCVMCLQVLKWNFLTPREEFVDQLKNQMAACVAKWLMEDLFHMDFQKHIKAIGTMMEVSPSPGINSSTLPCWIPATIVTVVHAELSAVFYMDYGCHNMLFGYFFFVCFLFPPPLAPGGGVRGHSRLFGPDPEVVHPALLWYEH